MRLLLVALLLMSTFAVDRCFAQSTRPVPPAPLGQGRPEDPWAAEQKREQQKKLNEMRQAEIKKDTDQLLQLATELKQYVDRTNENVMSVDVIKKAEQIEKLARSVKDKMKAQ
jgi:hypothetical protein